MTDKTKYFDYDTVKEMLYDLEYEGKEVELSDYPYIEIADEHGRCIDAEEVKELIIHACTCLKKVTLNDILGLIDETPTILEANE